MGWLRELMAQSGLRSFGELARSALGHPDWPADTRPQPRSLEAILGRLDRREDLDWLADRPAVQQVLATLLKCQVAEVRTVLLAASAPKSIQTRLRLDDAPGTRAIELPSEALPPGIPERVGLPGTWQRLAWIGGSGSGFSLTRHWLQARGLSQTFCAKSLQDLSAVPKTRAPLFLEVSAGLSAELSNPELAKRWLEELPGGRPVCLAIATSERLDSALLEAAEFEVVRSPPIAEQLEGIVDWLLARSAQGSLSRKEPLLNWLGNGPLAWGVLTTLGDVIGLAGMFLRLDAKEKLPVTKEAWLRLWLSHRSHDLSREQLRDKSALAKLLPQALVDIAQSAILDDNRSLLVSRSIEEWLELVPLQHQRGPDLDWLSAQIENEPQSLRARDVERAAKRMPPGAHRLVVTMRELLLLRPDGDSSFEFRPHFIARLLQSIALERTVCSLPVFWGEALLSPIARAPLIDALALRVAQSPEAIAEDLLEVVEAESAQLVSALETGFSLIGLQVLLGTELSESVALGLLEEQNALLLSNIAPLPQRRTIPQFAERISDSDGAFYLAAFALSELAKPRPRAISPLLAPWGQSSPPVGWDGVLDVVATTLRRAVAERPTWLFGAIRLLDRLRHLLGTEANPVGTGGGGVVRSAQTEATSHPIFVPAVLVDALELGVVEGAELVECFRDRFQFDLFIATIEARNRPVSEAMGHVWTVLVDHRDIKDVMVVIEKLPQVFWQNAPPSALWRLLFATRLNDLPLVWQALGLPAWNAWSVERQSLPADAEPHAPWRFVPSDIGERTARTLHSVNPMIREIVGERWPEVALELVEAHRTVHPDIAVQWLLSIPLTMLSAVATTAAGKDWHQADERIVLAIVRYLRDGIAHRASGFRGAYDCLNRFETERQRFNSLNRR